MPRLYPFGKRTIRCRFEPGPFPLLLSAASRPHASLLFHPLTRPRPHSTTVQHPLTFYAGQVGWATVPQEEATIMRRGESGMFFHDLLKARLRLGRRLVVTIAGRGKTTRNHLLELAIAKARDRFAKTKDASEISSEVVFNVQPPRTEPLLCIPDYLAWTVQHIFERGETLHSDFVRECISLIVDLYDSEKYGGSRNYYTCKHTLSPENKLGPLTSYEGCPSTA